jgi:hypothetical protein
MAWCPLDLNVDALEAGSSDLLVISLAGEFDNSKVKISF